jgi:hypothetical protein
MKLACRIYNNKMAAAWNLYLAFGLIAMTNAPVELGMSNSDMEVDHKYAYKFGVKYCFSASNYSHGDSFPPPPKLTFSYRPYILTAAARVRSQVRSCGICGGQSGTGAGFLRVLPHSSSSIIRGWYNRPNIGQRTKWTQSHPTPRN